jgi:uncharacterized membrane protein YbhN (UPF0104 family)
LRVLTRLTQVAGSPWLRGGLLAIVLAFCGFGLYSEWPQVTAGLAQLHWYSPILSLAAAMAGSSCLMAAWRTLLADLGSPLPVRAAARVNFIAQLGKYVPGAVWAFAAQVELGHDYQVPRRRSFASVATSLVITVGTGLVLALVTLPFTSPAVIRHYWWVLCAVPVIIAGLCPPVLGRVLDRVLSAIRSQPLEVRPSWRGLGRALAWNLAGWLLLGLMIWTLVSDMAGVRGSALLLSLGGYCLAYSAGMLLVVIPGGIGARELILVAALSVALPHGGAVAVALVSRLVTTVSDLLLGAVGLGLGRGAGRSASIATPATSAYAGTSPPSKSAAGSST